jgi:selenocysteine-specific elongation factor
MKKPHTRRMRNIIAGTAGHIDHGKTALVRALTGIDTDRLAEEKRRGISIDLGFAHLTLGDLRIGFVDVPGHERFVKNMLAGAAGIDCVILVIAADESVKPQTREHFDICRLLGIRSGLVALTKSDLVDADMLELVRLEVEEFVAGSFLAGAPVIPVSSVTGAGLDELKAALARLGAAAALKDAGRPFRLPIDRSFARKGFGAVVTGTLVSGAVRLEDEVEIHPLGRTARVRGIQVYGEPAARASAGERTAVNLAGVDHTDLVRGMVLAAPGVFSPTRIADCVLDLLPGAHPLKHRAPVRFHAGTAEIEAEARLLGSLAPIPPGSRGCVRLLFRDPALLAPGDRFIIRMFSPVVTIGGGVVLDTEPPGRMRRKDLGARLQVLESGTPEEQLHLLVREAPYGLAPAAAARRLHWTVAEVEAAAAPLTLFADPPWLLEPARAAQLRDALRATLKAFHREHPLLPGMPKEELRGRVLPGAPPFLLEALVRSAPDLALDGETARLAAHRVTFQEDESAATAKMEAFFRDAGLAVPSVSEALAKSGIEPARARTLLQILLKEKRLVKAGDDLVFHAAAISGLRSMLADRKGTRFSVPEFKNWTGVSRKYAIPLLELLDRERVTRRDGDARIVL